MKNLAIVLLRVLVHVAALMPLLWLYWAIPAGKLGGDPVKELIHFLGLGAIRLLLLTLAIAPLSKLMHFGQLLRLRRPLGLWCYAWACAHFSAWLWLDLALEWHLIGSELIKRTYILLGFSSWIILSVLAITSIPPLVRKLGRRWKKLHGWIYPTSLLVCVHFWWSLKSGWIEPFVYLCLTLLLLSARKRKLLIAFK